MTKTRLAEGVQKVRNAVITRNFKFRSNLQTNNLGIEIASHFVPCCRNDDFWDTLLKIKEFAVVNDCFQNEYNEVFGVFLQKLVKPEGVEF